MLACLSACAPLPSERPDAASLAAAVDRMPAYEAFAVCHGYGCWKSRFAGLTRSQWQAVGAIFDPAPRDADEERARVRLAIGLIERSVGEALGTSSDKPRTPAAFDDPSQLDCVDESINTTTYLHLLARNGLLRWHRVGEPASRHAFLAFGIHFTAVLVESATRNAYAVDSWFHANGEPAEVVELDRWRAGWEPSGR